MREKEHFLMRKIAEYSSYKKPDMSKFSNEEYLHELKIHHEFYKSELMSMSDEKFDSIMKDYINYKNQVTDL